LSIYVEEIKIFNIGEKEMITKEQESEYLENGGTKCPVCGSDDMVDGGTDFNGSILYQNVSCNDCQEEWTEEYKLSGISEAELILE
jgi:transposase-like protein